MDELTGEFLSESRDGLLALESALRRLEEHPDDPVPLAEAFRSVHTIKGAAGFLGFPVIAATAHAGEDLLGGMRDGEAAVTADAIQVIFRLRDWVECAFDCVGRDGSEPSEGDAALRAALARVVAAGMLPRPVGLPKAAAVRACNAEAQGAAHSDDTVRVRTAVLARVMDATGRLVVARNRLESVRGGASDEMLPLLEELDRITGDLREGAVGLRLRAAGEAFALCPRVARDVAAATGKMVEVRVDGAEIELDRAMLEALRGPLLHCVRNAVDHGIEAPAARAARGKPERGRLHVRATQQGGQIVIEIADDGAGMEPAKLREKAVAQRICTSAQAAAMTDDACLRLVFLPGFSTSSSITEISGRGVGMDVVKNEVEAIGGRVELLNRPGHGLTVRIALPLTLAIFAAQTLRALGAITFFPSSALQQVIGIRDYRVDIEAGQLYLTEDPVPLVNLRAADPRSGVPDRMRVLVVSAAAETFGIIVDDVLHPEQVAIRTLQPCLEEGTYCGAAVMGSGEIARQLDLAAVLERWKDAHSSEELSVPSAFPSRLTDSVSLLGPVSSSAAMCFGAFAK